MTKEKCQQFWQRLPLESLVLVVVVAVIMASYDETRQEPQMTSKFGAIVEESREPELLETPNLDHLFIYDSWPYIDVAPPGWEGGYPEPSKPCNEMCVQYETVPDYVVCPQGKSYKCGNQIDRIISEGCVRSMYYHMKDGCAVSERATFCGNFTVYDCSEEECTWSECQ